MCIRDSGRGAQSGQSVLGGVEDFSDVRRRPEVKFPIFSVDILISKLLRKEGMNHVSYNKPERISKTS